MLSSPPRELVQSFLKNIKDAIETYLATIEELTNENTIRVVEIPA